MQQTFPFSVDSERRKATPLPKASVAHRIGGTYYSRNKEAIDLRRRARIASNREKERARCAEYYKKNKERVLGYKRKHRQKYRDVYNARSRARRAKETKPTEYYLKKNYGLTLSQYREMRDAQDGLCAICGKADTSGKNLAVDHCHKTGRVRKLLCWVCNTTIGRYEDDPAILDKAAKYLRDHEQPNTEVIKKTQV